MAKSSTRVRNRTENASYVVSSTDIHGADVARALAEIDAALPESKRLGIDAIEAFLAWTGRVLEHTTSALTQAEEAYVLEQADDLPLREERDLQSETLLACIISVRARMVEVFSGSVLSRYGLEELAPRYPQPLLSYARTAAKLLRANPRRGRDAVGNQFDTVEVANFVDQLADKLDRTLGRLSVEKRELDAALIERNSAMETWERAYRAVAILLAGMYQLAGEDELARRIRPTERRALGITTTGEPDDTDEPVTDTDTDTDASADDGTVASAEDDDQPASDQSESARASRAS